MKEAKVCEFCECNLIINDNYPFEIDGRRFNCCESCMKNVFRMLDLFKFKVKIEQWKRSMKMQDEFIDRMVNKHVNRHQEEIE